MPPRIDEGPQGAASILSKSQSDVLTHSIGYLGLPAFLLTTFAPDLFGKLARYPKAIKLITIPLALWLAATFAAKKLASFWAYLMSYGMASVMVTSDDYNLHASFKRFLTTKKMIMIKRNKLATSVFHLHNQGHQGRTYERELAEEGTMVFDPENKFQLFFHKRRLFVLTTEVRPVPIMSHMRVWTFGWSTTPIEEILSEAYEMRRLQDQQTNITILSPYGGRQWQQRAVRPRRPLETVYLDQDKKQDLLQDMEEYLSKDTAKWYQDRGIPYRRGYLFHGAPGTGKTSLALSLAGHFKLTVYIVSLLDNDITDSALITLLQTIRTGSLLLLEDVDSAGLGRETDTTTTPDSAVKKATDKKSYRTSTRVTLSGLLNAIDGAGAPEGHILIMTSNRPDELEDALVRPGRVDVRVGFENASRQQTRDIFLNMYEPKIIRSVEACTDAVEGADDGSEKDEELKRLAEVFADKVPERRCSPAELQDFILLYKKEPRRAVEEVEAWLEKGLEEQRRKKVGEGEGMARAENEAKEEKKERREEKRRRRMGLIDGPNESKKEDDEIAENDESEAADAKESESEKRLLAKIQEMIDRGVRQRVDVSGQQHGGGAILAGTQTTTNGIHGGQKLTNGIHDHRNGVKERADAMSTQADEI